MSNSSETSGVMAVPAGESANFDGTSQLQVTIVIVYIVTSVLATVGLILRLYTGACLVRNLGLDALLLVASWAVYLASFIGMLKVMPCGFGKHLWSVTESQLMCYENMLLFLGVTYFWPPTLAKLSLIVLYHRINPSRTFRIALYIIAFTCFTYTVVFTIVLSAPCNPMKAGTTTCLNNIALAQAILNISTDGVLIIMPIVTIWGLQMPRKQKVAVACILGLGSGAVIASCVRIAYVRAMINNPDVTYTQGSAAVWSAVEINIGILCNCLAVLKPFIRRHLPWLKSLIGAASNSAKSGVENRNNKAYAPPQHHNPYHQRERKGSNGYQLHSIGADRRFGAETRGADDGSERSSSENGDLPARKGILVTTSIAMGRSSEGDVSTEGILDAKPERDFGAISTETRVAGG